MTTIKLKGWMATVSTAALLASGAAIAQETTVDTPTDDAQLRVQQGEPQVSVTIDDPDVDVAQGAPQVTVEQPQPEITVAVPEPNVTVEQQAPIITVEQAQPVVTVRIPEPIITIRVPRPSVDVSQADPDIAVEMPEPVVEFIRPEPRITIEESEPNIQVEQGEADVALAPAEDPDVTVEQADANVNIEQTDSANVEVSAADPQVNIEGSEDADVNVEQADAEIRLRDYETDEAGNMATDEERNQYAENMSRHSLYNVDTTDITNQTVIDARGEDVGEIDGVGMRGDVAVAIVSVGGFLGMGEHTVALPLDRLNVEESRVVLSDLAEQELEEMPEYDETEVVLVNEQMTVGEMIERDM